MVVADRRQRGGSVIGHMGLGAQDLEQHGEAVGGVVIVVDRKDAARGGYEGLPASLGFPHACPRRTTQGGNHSGEWPSFMVPQAKGKQWRFHRK